MSRSRTRRHLTAAAMTAALLLGGCGIQQTDVIVAGGPVTIEYFRRASDEALVFFRLPDGRLAPVPRSIGTRREDNAPHAPAEEAVRTLLAGPGEEDEAVGLGTALPPPAPGAAVRILLPAPGDVRARLPLVLSELDDTGLRQLICTISYATRSRATVRMTGEDGTSASGTCPSDLRPGVLPTRPASEASTAPPPGSG
ncbi:hypothetical protein V5N34_15715 [Streptomyces baarnensis]|uniref:hypothetical protein n=1 Tax=Streptomyces TaxID=1883 RepID=UPI0029B39275|nr:hypothetical protein [Streptomyces sp. ME02-6979.5a]MDX3342643.1 hypothetical protein [Streptomyces sp. ME02-6979.5a]